MKIAILGGSFNPVHNGHLSLAENVYLELGFDRIIFFPAYISPFKQNAQTVSAPHRLAMLEAATQDNPHFAVDDFELKRKEISYTIDTVRYCYERYPIDGKLGLIIGADLPENFYAWKDAKTLLALTDLIVGNRPAKTMVENGKKITVKTTKKTSEVMQQQKSVPPFIQLQNETLQISSTYIRTAIAQNKAWRYLVQNSTYRYIRENGLYQNE